MVGVYFARRAQLKEKHETRRYAIGQQAPPPTPTSAAAAEPAPCPSGRNTSSDAPRENGGAARPPVALFPLFPLVVVVAHIAHHATGTAPPHSV